MTLHRRVDERSTGLRRMTTYRIGDEVLRIGQRGVQRGWVTGVFAGGERSPMMYQVRVGLLTHLHREQDLRPAHRTRPAKPTAPRQQDTD